MARDHSLQISECQLGPGEPVFIVAEVGVNRNRDMNVARQLTDAAATRANRGAYSEQNGRRVDMRRELMYEAELEAEKGGASHE